MDNQPVDPGYGDPRAPVGSSEWAKNWRLGFQNISRKLPEAAGDCLKYFENGKTHRAWTLITDDRGKPFRGFEDFCEYKQPWGLGIKPASILLAHMATVMGDRAAELATVAPNDQAGRPIKSPHDAEINGRATTDKETRLRSILRAPEVIQELYRKGLVSQTTAALMGPKKPNEEKAIRVVQARQAVEAIDRPALDELLDRRSYRRAVDKAIREAMGRKERTPLEQIQLQYQRLSPEDQAAFLNWANQLGVLTHA